MSRQSPSVLAEGQRGPVSNGISGHRGAGHRGGELPPSASTDGLAPPASEPGKQPGPVSSLLLPTPRLAATPHSPRGWQQLHAPIGGSYAPMGGHYAA